MAVLTRNRPSRPASAASCLETFEQIYRDNADAVIGYFAARSRDPQAVADLTFETFSQAVKAFARFDPRRGSARSWLLDIAAATALSDRPSSVAGRKLAPDEIAELTARIALEHG